MTTSKARSKVARADGHHGQRNRQIASLFSTSADQEFTMLRKVFMGSTVPGLVTMIALLVSSDILQYGAGLSYRVYQTERFRITPAVEVVGWTVLGGKEFVSDTVQVDAAGDTIVNLEGGYASGSVRAVMCASVTVTP